MISSKKTGRWWITISKFCYWRISEEHFIKGYKSWGGWSCKSTSSMSQWQNRPEWMYRPTTGIPILCCPSAPCTQTHTNTIPPNGKVTKPSLTFCLKLFISVPITKSWGAAAVEGSTSHHCFLPLVPDYSVPMLCVIPCVHGWKIKQLCLSTVVFVHSKTSSSIAEFHPE